MDQIQIQNIQKKEDSELVYICDEANQIIGQSDRKTMRAENLIHRATYIFVIQNQSNKIFCHKRSPLKRYKPGWYSTCFGGVVALNETYESNAQKELSEEIGLNEQLNQLDQFYYNDKDVKVWGQIYYAFVDCEPINLIPQVEEVEFVELMSVTEIETRSKLGEQFAPDTLVALQHIKEHLKLVD